MEYAYPQGTPTARLWEEAMQREVKKAVEDAITTEITVCNKERNPVPMSKGLVESNPVAFSVEDTTYTLPEFLPLGSIDWPEALVDAWRNTNCTTIQGIFPSISRMWFTVDNRLILWDYREGMNFEQYDEVAEIITAVGTPTKPKSGIFESHITYIIPFATPSTVHLIGLFVGDTRNMKSARLLSLGYILSTELTITKIVCLSDQGRIFCIANDNTTVYELEYRSESTAMIPRMRLVSFSYWLSHVPIMSHFTYYTHTLREMWSKHQYAPLKDIVIDERMELLFTLDVESTICAWKITRKGIKRSSFITYKYVEFADSEVLYPLEKLFVIDPDADNCSLVAFATNGDQFRYRYNSYMSTSQVELYFGTRIKSYVDPQRRVSNCFAADNCVILSHCVDADSSDSLLVATSPKCVLPPHNMARDVIASFKPAAMNRVERVVAMAKVNEQVRVSPNDLCSQVTVSPTRYMIAHRHALSVYLQIKPVDTLFLILSASSGRSRDSLIERFSSIYSPTDYAAMLLQIAIGRLHPYSNYNGNYSTEQSFTLENEVLGVPSLDSLGKSIFEESSGRAMDAARQLLRAASVPGSDANYMTTGDARQITVTLSPFTNGTLAYVARTLYPLWDLPLTRLEERSVLRARSNLQSLTSYLERMNINVDNGKMFLVNVPQQWFKEKVVVTLPRGAGLTKQELVRLDLLALFNGYLLAKKALETCEFLLVMGNTPLPSSDQNVYFSQVVKDRDTSRRLGSHLLKLVTYGNQGITTHSSAVATLVKSCPNFCDPNDVQRYLDRSEVDAMTNNQQLSNLSEAGLARWFQSVLPFAAQYWDNGVLKQMCANLKALKREDLAIHLLLHAAQQMDSSSVALAIHLSESSGGSVQQSVDPVQYAIYQKKKNILEEVTSILVDAWFSHRTAVDRLLGSTLNSGTIWGMEPNDEFAHIVLFDWLLLPRDDPSLVKSLRAALVRSDSRFLGAFMSRKSLQYPDVYALYLRGTSRGSAQAVEQFVTLASTDANSIQADDCLQYRIDNMKQALSCATECNHSDKEEISRRLASLTAQKMLCDVIGVFLSSRCPTMDEVCEVNGVRGTQREVASHQLHSLQRYILTAQDLYETARIYSHFGGGEVQMELLLSVGASQNEILQAMQNCYQTTLKTTEEVSRLLLLRYYPALPEFPLPYVALWLEKEEFVRSPTGSTRTVDLMRTCRLEPLSIIWAYTALIDGNEPLLARQVAASGVSPAYLTCSLAYAASILYDYKAIGQVRQSHVTENVLRKVTESIRNAALDTHSQNDVEALKKAEEIIRETENRRLLHRF